MSAVPQGRVPPHNLDAERSLLGGILLDGETLADVQLDVNAADFYRESHRKIFAAMLDLGRRQVPVDRITLKDALTAQGAFEAVGGDEFIDLLDKFVPTAANLSYYAKIVSDKALARRLIEAAGAIAQMGYEQHGDVQEFADACEQRIFKLRSTARMGELVDTKQIIADVFRELERRYEHNSDLTGAPSGLDELDKLTNGFQPGNLVLVAARPSMGKTSLALDIARSVGRIPVSYRGLPDGVKKALGSTIIFEMEMPKEQLVERLLSAEARVDSTRIRTGKLLEADWAKLAQAAGAINEMHICIHDQARTVMEIRALSRRHAAKMATTTRPLRLIVVDYLQRMRGSGAEQRREEEVSRISGDLKSLAVELEVPVLAVSSLNRELEKRQHRKPQMSDLRESGALEFDADVILFVYREEVYSPQVVGTHGLAEIIIGKNRNGPLGEAKVAFVKEYTSFQNLGPDGVTPQQLRFDGPPPHTDDDR